MIKQGISQLLETEMDRKDFLKTMAFAAVAMTGAATLVKTLSNQVLPSKSTSAPKLGNSSQLAYGVSAYSRNPVAVSQSTSAYSA